jgi:hypothetical protein
VPPQLLGTEAQETVCVTPEVPVATLPVVDCSPASAIAVAIPVHVTHEMPLAPRRWSS